jgi:hypothetical protein
MKRTITLLVLIFSAPLYAQSTPRPERLRDWVEIAPESQGSESFGTLAERRVTGQAFIATLAPLKNDCAKTWTPPAQYKDAHGWVTYDVEMILNTEVLSTGLRIVKANFGHELSPFSEPTINECLEARLSSVFVPTAVPKAMRIGERHRMKFVIRNYAKARQ